MVRGVPVPGKYTSSNDQFPKFPAEEKNVTPFATTSSTAFATTPSLKNGSVI
jgi:hypothetical protein